MKILKNAMEKAEKGLKKALDLKEAPVCPPEGEIEKVLVTTVRDLISDLKPLLEHEKKKPAWLIKPDRIIDHEVLTVISQDAVALFSHMKIDDSRSMEQFCMEAAELFTECHYSEDPDYWVNRCFMDDVNKYTGELREALLKHPEWINTEHCSMHGNETARDLLERHMKEKYPVRLLDPLEGGVLPVICFKHKGLEIFVDSETAEYTVVDNGEKKKGNAWRTNRSSDDKEELKKN